jgi:hypothetical protein
LNIKRKRVNHTHKTGFMDEWLEVYTEAPWDTFSVQLKSKLLHRLMVLCGSIKEKEDCTA